MDPLHVILFSRIDHQLDPTCCPHYDHWNKNHLSWAFLDPITGLLHTIISLNMFNFHMQIQSWITHILLATFGTLKFFINIVSFLGLCHRISICHSCPVTTHCVHGIVILGGTCYAIFISTQRLLN